MQANLLVRVPNWVGDVIMALPALQALQQNGIHLQLFGKPWIQDLLAGTHMELFALEPTFWQNIRKMARCRASQNALLLTNSFSSALMARLATKNTIGYATDGRRCLLNTNIPKPTGIHELNSFWNLARAASEYYFPDMPWPKEIPKKLSLPLSAGSINLAKQRLKEANIHGPFWVLCPFAQGRAPNGQLKVWPHWRELCSQLKEYPLIICPNKNEEHLCQHVAPEATVISGLNLSTYAGILAQAHRVIANDSGPMHIAAAVGASTLGIFGVTDPLRTSPWGADYLGTKDRWPTVTEVYEHLQSEV